jgi:tRNA1Val (adenine37-N6)-methyltransferase
MPNDEFRFKQFAVKQDRCAMKVGTDGVVLGAWAELDGARRILDIGTGTGLLALMAAQRNASARVDAIEIDPEAAGQATENFLASPWADRLRVHNMDARRLHSGETFDAILCNPPYYAGEMDSVDARTTVAKHSAELSFLELVGLVGRLLAHDGKFAVIVPINREYELINGVGHLGLHLARRTTLHYLTGRPAKRVLLEMVRFRGQAIESKFVVENEPGSFTQEYRALLAPFMLKF